MLGPRAKKTCWGQIRKNMSGQMLKKQAGASAKKTSGTLNEWRPSAANSKRLPPPSAAAAFLSFPLSVPHFCCWHLPQLVFSAFAHSYCCRLSPQYICGDRGPKSLSSKSQFFMGPLDAGFAIFFGLPGNSREEKSWIWAKPHAQHTP